MGQALRSGEGGALGFFPAIHHDHVAGDLQRFPRGRRYPDLAQVPPPHDDVLRCRRGSISIEVVREAAEEERTLEHMHIHITIP